MNDTLYHYCSLETLIEILESNKIRLTDIRKLNDSSEQKWFYQNSLENLTKDSFYEGLHAENIDYFKEYISELKNFWDIALEIMMRTYLACFSKGGDLLGQWRGYGNDGKGVAIGFNKKILNKINKGKFIVLSDVKYLSRKEIETQMHLKKEKLNGVDLKELIKNDKNWFFDLIFPLDEYYLIKNPAFKEEQEARLLINPMGIETNEYSMLNKGFEHNNFKIEKLKYLAKDDNIVSYCNVDFSFYKNDIIKEIVLGPKCKATENDDIPELLNYFGYNPGNTIIKHSEATYI